MAATKKGLRAGIYIDGSNLFWAQKIMRDDPRWKAGEDWKVDYLKLKKHFKKNYSPEFYHYYGVTDDKPTTPEHAKSASGQKRFYDKLSGMGYKVITKPLKYIRQEDGSIVTKGDMDIELTLGVIDTLNDVDLIILVAGDCDYERAVKQWHAQGKFIRIYSFGHVLSWELKDFAIKNPRCSYKLLEHLKDDLAMG